jgi:hypothetical protein
MFNENSAQFCHKSDSNVNTKKPLASTVYGARSAVNQYWNQRSYILLPISGIPTYRSREVLK